MFVEILFSSRYFLPGGRGVERGEGQGWKVLVFPKKGALPPWILRVEIFVEQGKGKGKFGIETEKAHCNFYNALFLFQSYKFSSV